MKEILVISGKGGTGKTTITAALASLYRDIVVADCDVDAPDLHILLKPEITERETFYGGKLAVIERDKCTKCGKCRELCQFDAVSGSYDIDAGSCEGCGVCGWNCPEKAIKMVQKKSGESYISGVRCGTMVHALLDPGEENSGKLVAEVKKKAKALAAGRSSAILLVDGPPGIGCPVIASLGGADTALIVTEPSKSGIHDMERVINVAEHFKVPVKVIINKFDINRVNTGEIEKYLEKRKIEVLGKIPFSEKFDSALKQAKTINEFDPGCAEAKMVEEIKIRMESGSQAR
ncbi:MAG: ATP-binding protein [Elusimicrobia bacterium]|nr:ATP-binding protein [Elusimicrobiota bacterium]